MRVTVLGAGAFGTALARTISQNGHEVTLWAHDQQRLTDIQSTGRNERYLPGIDLPRTWKFDADINRATANAELVLLAVPSKAFRSVATSVNGCHAILLSATKGIEFDTGLTMTGVLKEVCPGAPVATISGPSLALETARDIPTAVAAASTDGKVAATVQALFHRPNFRVYTTSDVLGVELGGALKNVIAIAAGLCDGLGFGDNAKAALMTRGLVEMRRIGVACGALNETFNGLSGLGDLTVTCYSRLSRNRTFGERIGRGEKVDVVLSGLTSVAEGVPTARSAHRLAEQKELDHPIVSQVHAIVHEGKNPHRALSDLLSRESKAE